MSKVNFSRLMWQIPVLILVVAAFMPDVSWTSNAFGLWPVWLMSMPLMAFIRYSYMAHNQSSEHRIISRSQVLVFQKKPSNIIIRERVNSKAA